MSPTGVEASGLLLRDLFLLMRTVLTHGPRHPLAEKTANTVLQSLAAAGPPLALQFAGKAVFKSRNLIPLDLEEYLRSQDVARALAGMGAHELTFDQRPTVAALVQLGHALAQGSQGPFDVSKLSLPGISWREIPGAMEGREAEDVDPDVFCATHLVIAVTKAEGLVAGRTRPWNWSMGMSVVRRLENGLTVGGPAMARALEIAPGPWSAARRAVSATYRFLSVASALGIGTPTARAGAHATLAVSCTGLEERGGAAVEDAAKAAMGHLIDRPDQPRDAAADGKGRTRRVPPHRLRVCSLVHGTATQQAVGGQWDGILSLLQLVYDLERRRRPQGIQFALTFADLVAQAATEMGKTYAEGAVRALVYASGEIPAGANVKLSDGTVGIVLDRSDVGDSLRPKVLVGTRVVIPDAAVALISPAQVHATRSGASDA